MSIIGIDLGTTTSEVACYRENEGEIIKNVEEGDSPIIPSVVLIEKDQIKVGLKAKNQIVLKPRNTIIEIKKIMGTDEVVKIDNKEYSPVEISSMILKRIKEIAEFYLGDEVTEAVITVPAAFNDKARKDTKKAGEMAGLKVERIINEPTAAAIAYGINNMDKNMNVLVYDFGGGTIDVTVLELYNGVLDVKCSRGGNIGGKDIDEIIINYLKESFYKENNIDLDLKNPRILSTLKNVSEECKKNLSFQNEWDVIVPYITVDENRNPVDLNITVTQEILNKLIFNLVKSTENIIDDTLKGAHLNVDDIDKVILVGGSTRVSSIKNMMRKKFGVNKIVTGINPDETVAIGAAIQCAIKTNLIDFNKSIIVTDSCSYTLGVEVFGNKFDPIIKRDSKLPAKVTKSYRTVEDAQEEAVINIYEGEDEDVVNNIKLDSILIKDIPKNEKGKEVIDITFGYDLNGILNVDVEVRSTGLVERKVIKDDKGVSWKLSTGNEKQSSDKEHLNETINESYNKEKVAEKEKEEEELGTDKETSVNTVQQPQDNTKEQIPEYTEVSYEEVPRDKTSLLEESEKIQQKEKIEEELSLEKPKGESNLNDILSQFNSIKGETENNNDSSEDEGSGTDMSGDDLFAAAQAMLNAENAQSEQQKAQEKEAMYAKYDIPDDGDDYSTVFTEVAALCKYIDNNLKNFDDNIQSMVKDNLQDLAGATKREDFKRCRQLEHRILRMMGVE